MKNFLSLAFVAFLIVGCAAPEPDSRFIIDSSFTLEEREQIVDAIETWQAACPNKAIVPVIVDDPGAEPNIVSNCDVVNEGHEDDVKTRALGRTIRFYGETVTFLCLSAIETSSRSDALRVVTLHELGHFMGADHAPEEEEDSVMRTKVKLGELAGEPSEADLERVGCNL